VSVLILDPGLAAQVKRDREAAPDGRVDEVWDGVYVVPPLANNQHQSMGVQLAIVFHGLVGPPPAAWVFAGCNVSDRVDGWEHNYRCPDAAVFLPGNPAIDCGTHWCGGPDFGAEILSPGDRARDKRSFYAAVGVRELLIIDRDPWQLELYRLQNGQLVEVGRVLPSGTPVASQVLPVTFGLIAAGPRPVVEIAHLTDGRRWEI
jgi:Uma2 family endonuclease